MPDRFSLVALFLLLTALAGPHPEAVANPDRPWTAKVDPWVLESARGGDTEFIVFLAEQADLGEAQTLRSQLAKGTWVKQTLTAVAQRSQGPVLAALSARQVAHRSYWVANMIWVRGDSATVQAMAEREDVSHIYANPRVALHGPVQRGQGGPDSPPRGVEWNIALVNADSVWAAGITGTGAVVGGQDTGYRWDHPALINQYRGGAAGNHAYNWHDAVHSGGGSCGADSPVPCDDHGHGTHTMGTVVGSDGGSNQIGMAPTANWIGCRNMDQGIGTPITYAECFQWFIAPTDLAGQNPDPAMAPDVISNSWGCPASEGCTDPNMLLTVVQNVHAAGIATVHSAGNDGSGCSSVNTPAAIYDEAFTVAATDSSDDIASFSSRGPVTVDGSNRRKPDISAPGVSIRSSTRDGGYEGGWSGTSMASPHVAGLVALLISANPGLAGEIATIEEIIEQTAVGLTTSQGCGGDSASDIPNNVYGWGRIDAEQAFLQNLDFLVEATPASAAVCAPADAIFDLTVLQFQGFSDPVTLSVSGLPAAASADFSVNPVIPPGTSVLTVGDTGAAVPGSYDLVVEGLAGSSAHDATVTLGIYDQVPPQVTLLVPANGAGDQVLRPTLEWAAATQAETYHIEVATDLAFTAVILAATSDQESYTLDSTLDPTTLYYWRVRASNLCGEGTFSAPFSFTTRPVPATLLVDDDDNSPDLRTTYTAACDALGLQYDIWDTDNSDTEPSAGDLSPYSAVIWFSGDEFGGSAGPGASGESALGDWLDGGSACLLISSQDYAWDRGLTSFMVDYLGVAAVSDDDGQNTVTGAGSLFSGLGPFTLSYPFSDYSDTITPATAEIAFSGNQGTAAVSLDSGAFTTVYLAFPFVALPTAGDREAVLQAFLAGCQPASGIFSDGFESADLSAWSLAVP